MLGWGQGNERAKFGERAILKSLGLKTESAVCTFSKISALPISALRETKLS